MSNPIDHAKEYLKLWQNDPLEDAEKRQIKDCIAHLDYLTGTMFMEDQFLLNARIMLATIIEEE